MFVGLASLELARAPLLAARALDPLYLYPILNLAKAARDLGQTADALILLEEALALEPDAPLVLQAKVLTLAALGRLDEAAVVLEPLRVHANGRRLPVLNLHAAEHAVARGRGNAATADAALAAIMEALNDPETTIQHLEHIQSTVVPVLARTGPVDTALDIIECATRAGSVMPYDWFLVNPDLQPLRREPRFQAVAARRVLKPTR